MAPWAEDKIDEGILLGCAFADCEEKVQVRTKGVVEWWSSSYDGVDGVRSARCEGIRKIGSMSLFVFYMSPKCRLSEG